MNIVDRLRIWQADIEVYFEDLWIQYKKWRCEHEWAPALLRNSPAKHCRKCDTTLMIGIEEFYAVFGERHFTSMSYTVEKK